MWEVIKILIYILGGSSFIFLIIQRIKRKVERAKVRKAERAAKKAEKEKQTTGTIVIDPNN